MLKLTRKGEYAIQGIVFLASLSKGQVCILSDIADAVNVPQTSLAKIFQQFCKAGLVTSYRGTRGGFALGRPPHKITLLQVIESVECPVSVNQCASDTDSCCRHNSCGMHPIWVNVQEKVRSQLERVTLQDILTEA
jgi:Rrf2 family protein